MPSVGRCFPSLWISSSFLLSTFVSLWHCDGKHLNAADFSGSDKSVPGRSRRWVCARLQDTDRSILISLNEKKKNQDERFYFPEEIAYEMRV